MKSPFPGMDPYLETRWGDVHSSLCVEIRSALQPLLPKGLRARAQEGVLVDTSDDSTNVRFEPDVSIVKTSRPTGVVAVADLVSSKQPLLVTPVVSVRRDRWVEIIDTSAGNRVVTAIEVLSPSNKSRGRDNDAYRRKLDRYTEAGVNIVEIDLLRSSRQHLLIRSDLLPVDSRGPYFICVHRASREDGAWEVYSVSLREALPVVAVPCRASDRDVPLALQPLIEATYVDGAHDDIDYSVPPDPPFDPEDALWVAPLISVRQ